MQINLSAYAHKKICVAVSGGKDSMTLLHYFCANRREYGITVCAVNCDHGLRDGSANESEFVKKICGEWAVELIQYKADCLALSEKRGLSVETASRDWRKICYFDACSKFKADAVATAHHLNDNAETVLFNLARGTSVAGLAGIRDGKLSVALKGGKASYPEEGESVSSVDIIRPLINLTRADIDKYIADNGIPYVTDESNFSVNYTRNFIRLNVLPQFEKIAPDPLRSVKRLSDIAAEDGEFFAEYIEKEGLIKYGETVAVKFCGYRAVFKRAVVTALKCLNPLVKDYTADQLERLFNMQFGESGKRFDFLGFSAFKEGEKIVICREERGENGAYSVPYGEYVGSGAEKFCGCRLVICGYSENIGGGKVLKFDMDAIPACAEIRFMRAGDRFKKFKGGTKSLGDFFTDKKIPPRLRYKIPLVAAGNEVLIVCGVEISDGVKVTDKSERIGAVISGGT